MSIFLGNVFLRLGQFVEASKPYGYAISFLKPNSEVITRVQ